MMAHGDAREGKWGGNWRMEWVASTLHTTSEHGVSSITTADAHTSAATSRLNWCPRRFKWTRPFRRKTKSGFCACAVTFHTQATILKVSKTKRESNFLSTAPRQPRQALLLEGWTRLRLPVIIIIIIIIFINCNWVVTRWQWLFYMYTRKEVTRKFKSGGLHEKHVRSSNFGTISEFACRHRETKKNLCRGGRSQDLPDTDL